jgi:hypothetical protein
MYDEIPWGLCRWNYVGHVEECSLQGFIKAGLHAKIHPGQQIDSANKKCQIRNPVSGFALVASAVTCAKAVKQCIHFLKKVAMTFLHRETNRLWWKATGTLSKEACLERPYPEKQQLLCLSFLNNAALSVSIFTIINLIDNIIFQQMAIFRTSTRAFFVHITIMKDKWLHSVAMLTWMNT